jgi:WD40 repeat protein
MHVIGIDPLQMAVQVGVDGMSGADRRVCAMSGMVTYEYVRPSGLTGDGGLVLQTSGGVAGRDGAVAHPRFFSGFVTTAEPVAVGLLAVAEVARTRYFQPIDARSLDPVVTGSRDRLRFESFSGCCGVYARLDVLPAALDGGSVDHGTTNVDVNPPLREALARVSGSWAMRLDVGPDDLTVTTMHGGVVEKKVPLPSRWLRGFAEVQVIASGFDPRAELSAADAVTFLRRLPAGNDRSVLWAVPAGRSLRLTSRPVPGAVCLPGAGRLVALRPLLRFATSLRVYGPPVGAGSGPCASTWELRAPTVHVSLTPHTVHRWNVLTGDPVGDPLQLAEARVTALAAARAGDGTPLLLVGDGDGTVRRLDARSGAQVGDLVRPHGVVADRVDVVCTREGRIVLAVSARRRTRLFDARTGMPVGDPLMPWRVNPYGFAVAHLPDGRTLLVAPTETGPARLDLATGLGLGPVTGDTSEIWDVATVALPDGRVMIAGAGHDALVHRWDAATGAPIGEPSRGHPISVKSVAGLAEPGAQPMIFSGCEDGQVRRWDAQTGDPIGGPLPGDVGMVNGLVVVRVPGGRMVLVAVDFNGGLHQWDPYTGRVIRPRVDIPEARHLMTPGVDHGRVFSVHLYTAEYGVEEWSLFPGTLIGESASLRALYDDAGIPMAVHAEADGSLTLTRHPHRPPAQDPLPPWPEA